MTTSKFHIDPKLRDERENRFEKLCEHHEDLTGHDQTVPGADRDGRYVVFGEGGDKGQPWLTRVSSRDRAQLVCKEMMFLGHEPQALYDLDDLDGEEPVVQEGDLVEFDDERWAVDRIEEELIEGMIARYAVLVPPGHVAKDWDDWTHRIYEDEVVVIEAAYPDERLPVRYAVAGIVRTVVFDSVAS